MDLFHQIEKEDSMAQGKITWIIAGLGNPGMTYENTRHNAGFMAIDLLAKQVGVTIEHVKFQANIADETFADAHVLLLKPMTFMNNSGQAIVAAADFYKIPAENILVLYDDITLPPGRLRIRKKGSAGGHNGIKSIIAELGTEDFPRVRIGIGAKANPQMDLVDHVIGKFSDSEREKLEPALRDAVRAARLIIQGKIEQAMNQYN